MIYLFKAAFPTLGVMLYEIFCKKEKNNPLIYVLLFCAFALSNYIFDSCLFAKEVNAYECKLTKAQRDYYWKLIHEHYYQAWSCSYEAKSGCDFIPNRAKKVAAKAAITALTAGIVSRNIVSTAIATIIAALQEMLEQFGAIWENISCNLHCAQYNVEMAEFYQDVLFNDGA